MTLSNSSKPTWPVVLQIVLSLLGFIDATYLTVIHYTGADLPCRIFRGCDTVTTSPYSQIGALPVSLLGVAFYLTVFILTLIWILHRLRLVPSLIVYSSLAAFLFSVYFVWLQIWVIQALCLYCLISALLSTAIFVIAVYNKRV